MKRYTMDQAKQYIRNFDRDIAMEYSKTHVGEFLTFTLELGVESCADHYYFNALVLGDDNHIRSTADDYEIETAENDFGGFPYVFTDELFEMLVGTSTIKKMNFGDHGKWVVVLDNPEIPVTLFQVTRISHGGTMCVLNFIDHDPIETKHLRFATSDEIGEWLKTHNELTIVNPDPILEPPAKTKPAIGTQDNGTSDEYDMVNPPHYKNKPIETIEKMRRIWGDEMTSIYCDMTAFKYRDRIGDKPDQPLEQESQKIKWYENKSKEFRGGQ